MNKTLTMSKKFNLLNSIYRLPVIKRNYSDPKPNPEPKIPVNILKDTYTSHLQKENGVIAGKKPYKIRLEAGKKYRWCLCGHSHEQPFCDETHKNVFLKIKLRPVTFAVDETRDYWICTCKQTSNRPFCDGTHKRPDIQEMRFNY